MALDRARPGEVPLTQTAFMGGFLLTSSVRTSLLAILPVACAPQPDGNPGLCAIEELPSSERGAACGCLGDDPSWSCDAATCPIDGKVWTLAPEAGFFELEPITFSARPDPAFAAIEAQAPRVRMFYAFHPAQSDPEDHPLVVFFNGGPGVATSSGLLALGTSDYSLDLADTNDGTPVQNPGTWTTFANLLHVDMRAVGFSYELQGSGGVEHTSSSAHDAADFVRVILRFLSRHPALRDELVLLAGESYGGARATLMLRQLLRPAELRTGMGVREFVAPAIADEIEQYAAESCLDRVDAQFRGLISIQGRVISGERQAELEHLIPPLACTEPPIDVYDCSGAFAPLDRRFEVAAAALVQPEAASTMLGVEVTSIEWMRASARAQGRPVDNANAPDDRDMRTAMGELPDGMHYFVRVNPEQFLDQNFVHYGGELGRMFAENLRAVESFATDSRFDVVVRATATVESLRRDARDLVATVEQRGTDVHVEFHTGELGTLRIVEYDAGHAVSADQPVALRDDVREWLDSRPARVRPRG